MGTRRPLCSLSALSLIIDQFDLLHSLRVLWGAVIAQLLRPHILVPPPPPFFQNIFFGPRPSLQKNYKCKHKYKDYFLTTNEDRKDDLHIFHREMITNLTPCRQLVDTLLTPCWSFFQMCNCTIVTT